MHHKLRSDDASSEGLSAKGSLCLRIVRSLRALKPDDGLAENAYEYNRLERKTDKAQYRDDPLY